MHHLQFGCIAATEGNQVIHGLLMRISQKKRLLLLMGSGRGQIYLLGSPHWHGRKEMYNSLYRCIK